MQEKCCRGYQIKNWKYRQEKKNHFKKVTQKGTNWKVKSNKEKWTYQ